MTSISPIELTPMRRSRKASDTTDPLPHRLPLLPLWDDISNFGTPEMTDRDYQRRWRARNPGYAAAAARRWRRLNPEKASASRDSYRKRHPEKVREWGRQRVLEAQFLLALFRLDPCTDCGKQYPSACMEFDHCRGEKVQSVTNMVTRGWVALITELNKCDLVCANCHRIRTSERRKQHANL